MPYAVDLTLFVAVEDIPTGRLPERHDTREAAEAAGRAAVERYAEHGIEATYEVRETPGSPVVSPPHSRR